MMRAARPKVGNKMMYEKRTGSRDSRLVWRYSCRKCDQEMELRFPRGVKIARRPIATCEKCESTMEGHRVKGKATRKWFRNTNFGRNSLKAEAND
mgnify:CR=1 FL=1